MTAQQRREAEKAEHEAFLAACPTHHLLAMIGDKWTGLVLIEMISGPRRHSELRAALPSASQKMLTHTLRCAEQDGLVLRTITPSVPVRVDYELTELGRSLLPVLDHLKSWADQHMGAVFTARAAYQSTVESEAV